MKTIESRFLFKGNRDYVHGTDIFNELISLIPNICLINVKFLRPLHSQATWVIYSEDEYSDHFESTTSISGSFLTLDGSSGIIKLAPLPDKVINSNYSYDESQLNDSRFLPDESSISFQYTSTFSVIEELVSAMRFYCEKNSGLKGWRWAAINVNPRDFLLYTTYELTIIKSVSTKYRVAKISGSENSVNVDIGRIDFVRV